MKASRVRVNRAPVLTLWAAVVARRLGYGSKASLTLGKAVAALNAQSKGRRLGIFKEAEPSTPKAEGGAQASKGRTRVEILGRSVATSRTPQGLRAESKGKPIDPESVQLYLEKAFGENLEETKSAMEALAQSLAPGRLATEAYALYETFRPGVPEGTKGWGAKGVLDLGKIRGLTRARD